MLVGIPIASNKVQIEPLLGGVDMKRLIALAIALGFVSATAFAYGFGVPSDDVYEREEQNAAYQQQQQQMQLYYQQMELANRAKVQNYYIQTAMTDIANGNMSDVAKAFIEQNQEKDTPQDEQPKSLVPMYQNQYNNAMAANQSDFAIKSAGKIMTPYYEQQAKIQGQMGVTQAQGQLSNLQYVNQLEDMKRKNNIARVRCNSAARTPMDDLACSDQDYANYMYGVGKQEYNMRKTLDNWLHI